MEICHITTPEVVELVNEAKYKGVYAIAETCPHYLFLNENALNEVGVFAKCNPPLRSEEERQGMWEMVNDGSIDIIGSDHAPYTKEEKKEVVKIYSFHLQDFRVYPPGYLCFLLQ